jgi:hypothetical protein
MKFKQFLVESEKQFETQVELIFQKLLDSLDESHIDIGDDRVQFNVGKIIKDSTLNNLSVVIRANSGDNTRLGTDSSGRHAIVIDTTKNLPNREKVVKYIKSAELAEKFKKQVAKYLEKHYDSDAKVEPSTSHEKNKQINSGVEKHYDDLVKAINAKMDDYRGSHDILRRKHKSTGSAGEQEIITSAMSQLKRDLFGHSEKEFMGIALKLPQAEFIQHLAPEAKKKILSRLSSYYEHKADEYKDKEEK